MKFKVLLCVIIFYATLCLGRYQPGEANLQARKWFEDARFGLFIHWGIYSQLSRGEWVWHKEKMSLKNYEQLASLFNPTKFSAAEWVAIAKAAGMRYITITTKHHDGFAMFGTKQNIWNIVDSTPYGQDILKQLADECHKQGIKLFCYYSQLDWYHTDYFPRGNTGYRRDRPNDGNWELYVQFMNAQLTELLTQYGEIAGIWFDGWWDKSYAKWDLETTFNLIHQLQPNALIGSNHHLAPFDGQDFQMFEKDLPGQNTNGFEGDTEISKLPLESCVTINKRSWGVDLIDATNNFRTTKEMIHDLVGAAGRGANLLLNVGPRADGTFPQEAITILKEMGLWLSVHGESIYGTQKGPLEPRSWGVTTRNASKIYIHLLDWKDGDLLWLPIEQVSKSYYLTNQQPIEYEKVQDGILIKNISLYNAYDTVLVLETQAHKE